MIPIKEGHQLCALMEVAVVSMLLCLSPSSASSEGAGLTCWNMTYEDASARCVVPGVDGGFVMAGQAKVDGGKGLLILKVDEGGELQWYKTYEFTGQDTGSAILAEADRYALACTIAGSGTGDDRLDIMLLTVDDRGYWGWNETLKRDAEEYATGICRSTDQGYVLSGYALSQGRTRFDAIAAKFGQDSTLQWIREYPSGQANDIVPGVDGGYLLAGSRDGDGLVIKIDEAGEVVWERTYGGPEPDVANSIVRNGEGGYLVAGYTESSGAGDEDFWVFEIDAQGEMAWERTYGTQERDSARSLAHTNDGFVLGGYSGLYPMGAHFVGIDAGGDVVWETGFMPTKMDMAYAVASDGNGFVGVGSRATDLFALGCQEAAIIGEGPLLLAGLFLIIAMSVNRSSEGCQPE